MSIILIMLIPETTSDTEPITVKTVVTILSILFSVPFCPAKSVTV